VIIAALFYEPFLHNSIQHLLPKIVTEWANGFKGLFGEEFVLGFLLIRDGLISRIVISLYGLQKEDHFVNQHFTKKYHFCKTVPRKR
jgi:hypothetical protein